MKRYEVTGPAVVFDHVQGEQFERDIPEDAERALVEAGTLTVVDWPDVTPEPNVTAEPEIVEDDGA